MKISDLDLDFDQIARVTVSEHQTYQDSTLSLSAGSSFVQTLGMPTLRRGKAYKITIIVSEIQDAKTEGKS